LNMAYYSWTFGSTALLGERDWLKRWKMMAPALEPLLAGAHILDLGCNLGLLDTFCALHGAEQVIAVDLEHDILAAAASVAETAGIEEKIVFKQGDLNSAEFVDSLLDGRQHTLVCALSVLHWIKNKDTVLRLVSSAPHLLYEGHGQPSEERELLVGLGFRDVRLLGYSERLRALYFASR